MYVREIPALGREVETSLASTVNCRPGENLLKKKMDGMDEMDGMDGIVEKTSTCLCTYTLTCIHVCVCRHPNRHSQ